MLTKIKSLRKNRWFSWAMQIGIVVLIYFSFQLYQTRSAPSGKLPIIQGQLLNGEMVRLPDDLKSPTLIQFWATWCSICRIEQGSIDSIADDYEVIAIASQSGHHSEVKDVVGEREITAPVLVDESGLIASRFGVKAFPTSFIVDADGEIRFTEVGYTTELGLRFRLWMANF